MKQFDERYLTAIDLGSAKIGICVALVQEDDVTIVHYKEVPSAGILHSAIYIPMLTAKAVRKAIEEAEEELMIKIERVVVGMPRNDVIQVTASATMERQDPEEYVSQEEVQAIKDKALDTYPLPNPDRQAIFGAIAQSFTIDEGIQLSEKDIVGTLSPTLEGNFKVFVGRKQAVVAIEKMFRGSGVEIGKQYFLPEVMGRAVLSKEELKNGVALVDIGAGVTSIAIYRGNIMRYYDAIPFGGSNVTADIETECSLDEDLSEKIKKRFGFCQPEKLGTESDKILQIRLTEPYREISVKYISEIVTARYRELIEAILYHIGQSGLQNSLRGGIVITGGAAEQKGLETMIKEMSGYSVRKGYPKSLFKAPAGSFVFRTSSTAAIGMILAANNEGLPDCSGVSSVLEVKKEESIEETQPRSEQNQSNQLFPEANDGGATTSQIEDKVERHRGSKGRGRKRDTDRNVEQTGTLKLIWNTVEDKLLKLYDNLNE